MDTDRSYWLTILQKLSNPLLDIAIKGELYRLWDCEDKNVRSLEAVSRLLVGIAPWLESNGGGEEEVLLRKEYRIKAQQAMLSICNPNSKDYAFPYKATEPFVPRQLLVDCAFLAHAMLRAPNTLFYSIDKSGQEMIIETLLRSRIILPGPNNWVLFSAMVESALIKFANQGDICRIGMAITLIDGWYLGDGVYGDGRYFAQDYYNSFVIHPMLLDIVELKGESCFDNLLHRAQRYGAILERMISPDGTYPATGRSIVYRCGAFQLLAQLALQKRLSAELMPAQVRGALQAVICRTLDGADNFDANGILKVGLCGSQPSLGENYIYPSSCYLASTALLPLGLSPEEEFWSAEPQLWSSQKLWSGVDMKKDSSIK